MRIPTTVSNWLADAESTYAASLATWFPADFDREAFCADVPAMAERLGETWAAATAPAAKARLEELAEAAFRGAYLGALALLAAYDEEEDPAQALDRLTRPLSDEETDLLGESFAEDVSVVESGLAIGSERRVDVSERASRALAAALRLAVPLREILAPGLAVGAKTVAALGARSGPLSQVLSGVVNVAIAVAALRHTVSAEADEELGGALAFDPSQLEAAFGLARGAGESDDDDEETEGDDADDEPPLRDGEESEDDDASTDDEPDADESDDEGFAK